MATMRESPRGMRPIIDKFLAIALDSQDANEKDLDDLCSLLLDEGKSRMPRHQRRMQFLKAKKASNC